MTSPETVEPTASSEDDPVGSISTSHDPENLALARFIAEIIDEQRGQKTVILDIGGQLDITNYFVIATASSERHAWAMAAEIEGRVKKERQRLKHHLEGQRGARWVLVDFGAIVVHLFCADTREYYDLEFLWGHLPRVPLVEGGEVEGIQLPSDSDDDVE
jgi:ribosome-associated protein